LNIGLTDVLSWIAKRENTNSFVIHLDETNFIAEDNFLKNIMGTFYNAMLEYFLVVELSGTDVKRLTELRRTSGFSTYPLHIPPLSLEITISLFMSFASKYGFSSGIMNHFDLAKFLSECGGNPQLLKFQIQAMEDVGISWMGVDQQVNVPTPGKIGWTKTNLPQIYIDLKKCLGWSGHGFEYFLKSPSSDKVTAARNKTWVRATTSHILGFESLEQVSMIPLREMIFGYTISGDIVNRETILYDQWKVYDAESKGLLYLKEIETKSLK